jgi:D-alanine-D-alanine ligase
MHRTVVGVLRGGPSSEHEVSLKSGHTIISNLSPEVYEVRDIYIDKETVWHERGLPIVPGDVLPSLDVAIVALHGPYGQDGEVQKVLDLFSIPHTGARSFSAFEASHKLLAKEKARVAGVKTPAYFFANNIDDAHAVAHDAVKSFHPPVIVKPAGEGSSVGVSLVSGYEPIRKAIENIFTDGKGSKGVLVEERIVGTEATVGVVEGFRGETLYALPPVEIVPPGESKFFSFEAKYGGKTQEICPARFPKQITDELMELAKKMHEVLDQRHYSRSDFIVSSKGIYFLECNTAAAVGMTSESLFPKALKAVGASIEEFLSHIITFARNKK